MKSDLVFISSKNQLNLEKRANKFFDCLFCNNNIKSHLLSSTKNYYYCKNCQCHYIQKKEIIIKMEFDINLNNKYYFVQLDLIKNKTNLVSAIDNFTIYSYDECLAVSPFNIKNKVQTWLLMQ